MYKSFLNIDKNLRDRVREVAYSKEHLQIRITKRNATITLHNRPSYASDMSNLAQRKQPLEEDSRRRLSQSITYYVSL